MTNDEVKSSLDQALTSKPGKFLRKRPGRPKKVDLRRSPTSKVPDPEQLYEYGQLGMTLKHVADALGISYSNLFSMFDRYPVLSDEYMRGRGDKVSSNLKKLQEHIDAGKTGPLYFWLERVAGFGSKVDLGIQSAEKPPIQLSSDQIRRMAEATLASFPDEKAVQAAQIEVEHDVESASAEIEAGVAEGRMLLRQDAESGRMPPDDRQESEPDSAERVKLLVADQLDSE